VAIGYETTVQVIVPHLFGLEKPKSARKNRFSVRGAESPKRIFVVAWAGT
jgi:hypothetical protein